MNEENSKYLMNSVSKHNNGDSGGVLLCMNIYNRKCFVYFDKIL